MRFAATQGNLKPGNRLPHPRLGLGVAIEYALALGLKRIEHRVQGLAALLRERLAEVQGVTVRDLGRVRCGIVTFTYEGHSAEKSAAVAAGKWHRGTNY